MSLDAIKGALVPVMEDAKPDTPRPLSMEKAVRQGMLLILMGLVIFLLLMANSLFNLNLIPSSIILFAMMTFVVAGGTRMFLPLVFGTPALDRKLRTSDDPASHLEDLQSDRSLETSALRPANEVPPVDFSKPPMNMAEMPSPPSVTERTTKLLEDQ